MACQSLLAGVGLERISMLLLNIRVFRRSSLATSANLLDACATAPDFLGAGRWTKR